MAKKYTEAARKRNQRYYERVKAKKKCWTCKTFEARLGRVTCTGCAIEKNRKPFVWTGHKTLDFDKHRE